MNNIAVSIIIPVYNQEKFLDGCLHSLADQSLQDIEVIVVDDGSTDKSLEIAKSYQKQYDFFKVFSIEKSGQAAARNEGIKIADGNYVGFVDSDDFVDSVMFEELYKMAIEHDSELVKCGAVLFDSDSKQILGSRTDFEAFTEISSPATLLERYLKGKLDRVVWNGIYHRRLFKKIRFPEVAAYADQYFTPGMLAETNKYIYLPKNFYFYRQHSGALSYRRTSIEQADRVQSLNEIFKIMSEHQLLENLAESYSKYFYNLVNGYHNQTMYANPLLLRQHRYSIKNLIEPEVFAYVLSCNHLSNKQIRFLKVMKRSHYFCFLLQKLDRIKEVVWNGERLRKKPGKRRGRKIDLISERYLELIQRYA